MTSKFVLAALVAMAAPMQGFAQETFEVARAGDAEMSCETLTSNIAALDAQVQEQERGVRNRETAGRFGRGLLSGLARGASMMGGGGLGERVGGVVAAQALAGIASEIANAPPSSGTSATTDRPASPQQLRMQHLQGIQTSRPC